MDVARQTVSMYDEARERDGLFFWGRKSIRRQLDGSLDIGQTRGMNQRLRDQKNFFLSKPFKCGICGFRSAQKSNATTHLRIVHKVDSHEARRLIKVLSLDVAEQTLEKYKKKFVHKTNKKINKNLTDMAVNDNNNKVNHQITQLDNASSANCKIEPVDAIDANEGNLSSKKQDSQTELEIGKQQSCRRQPQLKINFQHRRPAVENKKFKCVECFFRSNWSKAVLGHFSTAHPHLALTRLQQVQVLEKDEATRTLADYETDNRSNKISCRPFKCGMCEFRAAQKFSAHRHMCQVHKVEFHEARRLIKIMSLDEAKQTLGEYNKNYGLYRDIRFFPKWLLKRKGETESVATTSKKA
jgi:hypothetical protein